MCLSLELLRSLAAFDVFKSQLGISFLKTNHLSYQVHHLFVYLSSYLCILELSIEVVSLHNLSNHMLLRIRINFALNIWKNYFKKKQN